MNACILFFTFALKIISLKIYSENNWWWLLLIFIIAASVAVIQYLFHKKNNLFSYRTKIFLALLRFGLLFIIGVLLLNFYSKFFKEEYIKPSLILAVDNSASMIHSKDSLQVKNFFQTTWTQWKEKLQQKFDVQLITFGDKINFNPQQIKFNEQKTNVEDVFNELPQVFPQKTISAMLMITDGIFNEGNHPLSLSENINYPVYIIGTGDTTIYKDVFIKKISCNKTVFLGNDLKVDVLIQSLQIKNEKVKISLFENHQLIEQKETFVNGNEVKEIPFLIHAEKPGYHTYKVILNNISDEKNIHNNTSYFVVNVVNDINKILITHSAPHPDISAIHQALKSYEQYSVEVLPEAMTPNKLSDYDIIIYHNFNGLSNNFDKYVNSGIPIFIISGNLYLLQNKWLSVKQLSTQFNETESILNTSFSDFTLTDEYKEICDNLPVIKAPYGNYAPLGNADVLFYQKINNVLTELPLFYLTQNTNGKYAVFLGDGLWRWRLANYQLKQNHEWFNHLISQTMRYLLTKKNNTPFKVEIPASIYENEPLKISAELKNESMQPITEPDVFMQLSDSNGNDYSFVFSKTTFNYTLNAGMLPAGEYRYKASTQYKGKNYTSSGTIHILPVSIEKSNMIANHSLLKSLTEKTHGKFFTLSEYHLITDELLNNKDIKTIVTQDESYQYWIDNKWWFVILMLILFTEWFIRRWNGTV